MKKKNPQVNIFNRQRKLRFDRTVLWDFTGRLTHRLQVRKGFSIVLLSDGRMREYNQRFAGRDEVTDVLTFPDQNDDWADDEAPYLGDVLISVEQAERQRKGTLERELCVLILHGVLHLLGYDHERDDGQMVDLEESLQKEWKLC